MSITKQNGTFTVQLANFFNTRFHISNIFLKWPSQSQACYSIHVLWNGTGHSRHDMTRVYTYHYHILELLFFGGGQKGNGGSFLRKTYMHKEIQLTPEWPLCPHSSSCLWHTHTERWLRHADVVAGGKWGEGPQLHQPLASAVCCAATGEDTDISGLRNMFIDHNTVFTLLNWPRHHSASSILHFCWLHHYCL